MPSKVIPPKAQQLHTSNISANVNEALEARTKDALWFLARQWQTGEFVAENGGRPAQISIDAVDMEFKSVTVGKQNRKIDRADPLEAVVEAEQEDGDAPAWKSEALEYEFGLTAQGHKFVAKEYDGRALDWHDFEYDGVSSERGNTSASVTVTPTQLFFRGAPQPRWWEIEDGAAYFDSPEDPEPNVLSLLLPEFFYTDIDNWFLVPMPMLSGSLRKVNAVTVVDSFGIATGVNAATSNDPKEEWALFALDAAQGAPLDGSFLFAPNVALDVLNNDELEEVRFIRDEDANLVWAWERQILDEQGRLVSPSGESVGGPGADGSEDGLPRFVLKSATERSWIPYVPRRKVKGSAVDGEIVLRRARTDEAASEAEPQYRSQIVSESKYLFEEEIPPTGLRVRRIHRYARGSNGKVHFWVGRDKEVGMRTVKPNLRFDYLDDG